MPDCSETTSLTLQHDREIKKGETMDFEEIEELNEEDMNVLYNDIVEFGDEVHLACCSCDVGWGIAGAGRDFCFSWCRYTLSFAPARCSWWSDDVGFYCPFRC